MIVLSVEQLDKLEYELKENLQDLSKEFQILNDEIKNVVENVFHEISLPLSKEIQAKSQLVYSLCHNLKIYTEGSKDNTCLYWKNEILQIAQTLNEKVLHKDSMYTHLFCFLTSLTYGERKKLQESKYLSNKDHIRGNYKKMLGVETLDYTEDFIQT